MPIKLLIPDLDDTLCDTNLIRACPDNLKKLRLFPDALSTLLALRVQKVLVTMGEMNRQQEKVVRLTLDKVLDRCVYCTSPAEKGIWFRKIIKFYGYQPAETMIVGDRVDNEIFYGNEIGCVTVRIRRDSGKYAHVKALSLLETPQFEIKSLSELIPLISSL